MAQPIWLLLLVASLGIDYIIAGWVAQQKNIGKQNRLAVGLAAVKAVLMILITGVIYQIYGIAMPLGIQVYTLTALGYIIDVYRGDTKHDATIVEFGLFCCFFGKIFAGPILIYTDFKQYLKEKEPSLSMMSSGLVTFVWGFAKQTLLAKGMSEVYGQLLAIPISEHSVIYAWSIVIAYTFSLYYMLSGFCDMARGLALIFSFKLPRNYYYPFQSRTVQDFFNHFNITFTKFVQKYVYLSLGGDNAGVAATVANTLLTTILMGLWFGIRLNLVLWGIYFTLFILLEKYLLKDLFRKIPPIFLRGYTFAVVIMSFTIFAAQSMDRFLDLIKTMFGIGEVRLFTRPTLYVLSQNFWLFFIEIIDNKYKKITIFIIFIMFL
ncbi:MAG: MBOAT family O-acyltransferase [Clostridia bacterium]